VADNISFFMIVKGHVADVVSWLRTMT